MMKITAMTTGAAAGVEDLLVAEAETEGVKEVVMEAEVEPEVKPVDVVLREEVKTLVALSVERIIEHTHVLNGKTQTQTNMSSIV